MSRSRHNSYFDRTKGDKFFERWLRKRKRHEERRELGTEDPNIERERKTKFANKQR